MRNTVYGVKSFLAAAFAFLASAPAYAQQINTLKNGEAEVSFSNGCVVYYDNRGTRTHNRPGCSSDQIRRADNATATDGDEFDSPPEVIVGGNGEGEVIFERNDCVVYYNARGTRKSSLPACSRRQVSQADDAMARYRREQGLGGDDPEYGGGYGGERALQSVKCKGDSDKCLKDARRICGGSYQVYDSESHAGGLLYDAVPGPVTWYSMTFRCGPSDGRQPRFAYTGPAYDGGYQGGPPEVIVDNNGSGRVEFSNRCYVYYDRRGRRTTNSQNCVGNQVHRADQAMATYRREQGLGSSPREHSGGGQLTLYQDVDFGGRRLRLTGPAPDLRDYGFDDLASSVRVEGLWYVCTKVNYSGDCTTVGTVSSLKSKWNKQISSARPGP